MITSIKELHSGLQGHGEFELTFFNYIVARVVSGGSPRYDVYQISNVGKYKRIACECPLEFCRELIRKEEPAGTKVQEFKAVKRQSKRTVAY